MSYKGEISLHFDPPSQYSCCVWRPLLREVIRIRTHRLSSYARFVSYYTFANLLSFFGIEEVALVIKVEIQSSLHLYVHFEQLHPGPFN